MQKYILLKTFFVPGTSLPVLLSTVLGSTGVPTLSKYKVARQLYLPLLFIIGAIKYRQFHQAKNRTFSKISL